MKINKKLIKELVDYLNEFNLSDLEYSEKSLKIRVSKNFNNNTQKIIETKSPETIVNNSKPKNGTEVKSPIIGTAYLAPEPGAKKFIEVGKKIKKGDTIMIVEAMKTMNHVPSPKDGVVKEVLVEDGQPVEYGQTLALLE